MNECKIETMQADGLGKFVGEKPIPMASWETKLEDERIKHEQ